MKRFFSLSFLLIVLCFSMLTPLGQAKIEEANASQSIIYADDTYGESSTTTRGGIPIVTTQERINYAYRTVESYSNPYELPRYISAYTCGITAGGNVIGYYDRIYENLIPNHTGRVTWGMWFYGSQGTEVNTMFSSLYSTMNATPEGVTLNGYLTGISNYATSRGNTASFTRAMSSSGVPNSSQYKAALLDGKLLSVFFSGFSIVTFTGISVNDGYDIVTADQSNGAHIMVAYGYYEISYYNSANQCFRTDSYLYVASGYTTPALCIVPLNQYGNVDDCYITEIY